MSKFIDNDKYLHSGLGGVLILIPEGEKRAISMDRLAYHLNCDPRTVRKMIELLRKAGAIVASSECGYFIPEDAKELARFYARTNRRARTTEETLAGIRRYFRMLPEGDQICFEDYLFEEYGKEEE